MALKLGNKTPLSNSGMIFELWRFDPAIIDKIDSFASHKFLNIKHCLFGWHASNILLSLLWIWIFVDLIWEAGQVTHELLIGSRVAAAECMRKILRHRVMVSSTRQAVSGFLTVGAVHGVRYLANKMHKAWKSWT